MNGMIQYPANIIGGRWLAIIPRLNPNGGFERDFLKHPPFDATAFPVDFPVGTILEAGIKPRGSNFSVWRQFYRMHAEGLTVISGDVAKTDLSPTATPAPMSHDLELRLLRAKFEAAHILKLSAAVRSVGIGFRNGASKAKIVDLACADIGNARRIAEYLETPDIPTGDGGLGALIDDAADAPASPSAASTVDLSDYIKRDEHTAAIGALAKAIADAQSQIADLTQNRGTIILNFPDQTTKTISRDDAHFQFPKLVHYLQCNRRVMLTGSAGSGKSYAAIQAAEALGVDFYLQNPGTQPHELIGYVDPQGRFIETAVYKAYKYGGLCLVDEYDNWAADALLVGNALFDDNDIAVFGNGEKVKKHPQCYFIANCNTTGHGATMQYTGRTRLDGASLNRFPTKIDWQIDPRVELSMALGFEDWLRAVQAVRRFIEARGIQDINATPRNIMAGARLLRADVFSRREILEDCLRTGALYEVWSDITRLPEVSSYLNG